MPRPLDIGREVLRKVITLSQPYPREEISQSVKLIKAILRSAGWKELLETLEQHVRERRVSRDHAIGMVGLYAGKTQAEILRAADRIPELRVRLTTALKKNIKGLHEIFPSTAFTFGLQETIDPKTGARIIIKHVGDNFRVEVREKKTKRK